MLLNHKNCVILKFPVFVGNGILKKLSKGDMKPYGTMEIITLDKVVDTVETYLLDNSLKRVHTILGERIEAKTVVDILKI